jgi:ankyrin repeat protein
MVAELLQKQPAMDVDQVSKSGRSALIVAVMNGHWDVVELLLESNASVAVEDNNGRTCIDFALERGDGPAAALLLKQFSGLESIDLSR